MSEYSKVILKIAKRIAARDHKQVGGGCSCEVMAFCRWADAAVECEYRVPDIERMLHCDHCLVLKDGTMLCENQSAINRMS